MSKVTFSREVEEALRLLDQNPAYVATCLKYKVGDEVLRILTEKDMSRADLAKRLGKSRQYVTKMLRAQTNFTLETIAALSVALEKSFQFTFAEPGIKTSLWRVLDGGKAPKATITIATSPGLSEETFAPSAQGPVTGLAGPKSNVEEAVQGESYG